MSVLSKNAFGLLAPRVMQGIAERCKTAPSFQSLAKRGR
jgi:hypothetical protein